ncbi:dirigent protein 2-like [Coffea arabica]|uniref:Dirigent protein n=1 Tax=Coffea arabica TaxID=13443 RepID=A0A6P6S5T9_COFAR|nr:dirigent protein 2-like [Coffea arabica]
MTELESSYLTLGSLPNVTRAFNQFGTVFVADNILTRSASFKSALVGRFQGIGAVASLDGTIIETLASIRFTSGEYSGSTVELKGIGSQDVNEMAIVGGTKQFRYATGYTTFETVRAVGDFITAKWDLYIRLDIPDDYPGINLH